MKLKVYQYTHCGTCRKALKFLEAQGVEFASIPIREQPPTKTELRMMLKLYGGNVRKLFNTSGQDYKKLNLKERLPSMTEDEVIALLSTNGNLVKRPFAVTEDGGLAGFREEEWVQFKERKRSMGTSALPSCSPNART
jgi:arsenate reductase